MRNYISEKDKNKIKRLCESKIKAEDLIRVKSISIVLEEKYCLHDILKYIKKDLGIKSNRIYWGTRANYVITLPRGHVQIINDVHFNNKYYHQYVVTKELGLDIEEVDKYIIHHIDENKGNNDINNLFIFYDTSSHIAFHQALKHNKNLDIEQFNNEYIDTIINQCNIDSIRAYLKILNAKKTLPLINNNGRVF